MLLQMILATMHTAAISAVLPDHFSVNYIQVISGSMPRLLNEFIEHYHDCKALTPTTTACILVPQFLLPALRPLLKGMHIIKTFSKGSSMFDSPTLSGQRRPMTGVHWPVHVFIDAPLPVKVAPVVTGQKCHPLHNAAIHECFDSLSPPVPLSNSPLAMLFSGQLEPQEATVLLDSGASANFLAPSMLSSCGLHLKKTDATLELADGHESPILGTTQVRVHLGALRCNVECFELSYWYLHICAGWQVHDFASFVVQQPNLVFTTAFCSYGSLC